AVEADGIAHADHAATHDRAEDAARPVRPHRLAQAGQRLVHALAPARLAADVDHALADAQQPVPAVRQAQPADHEVGAPAGRVERATQPGHQPLPDLLLDDRDLPASVLIRVPLDPAI